MWVGVGEWVSVVSGLVWVSVGGLYVHVGEWRGGGGARG